MPILDTDILYKGSGADNLGGAIAAADVSSELHGFFDVISGQETLDGDIEYRCLYIKNAHPTLTLYNARAYLASNTPSAHTDCAIGAGAAGVSATEPAVANESTAPGDVDFSAPSSYADGVALGDLAPGQYRAVWIRRTVLPESPAYNNDGIFLAAQGDSAA